MKMPTRLHAVNFATKIPTQIEENGRIHRLIVDGVDVEITGDGTKGGDSQLIDFDVNPERCCGKPVHRD